MSINKELVNELNKEQERIKELEGIMSEALSNMEYYSASLGEYWLVADKDIQSMQAALQERGE